MQHFIDSDADDLVDGELPVRHVSANCQPNNVVHLLRCQLVEDAIGASKNIVQLFATVFLVVDVGVTDDNVGIATELLVLRLEITERPAH